MESNFQLTLNGQQITIADLSVLGTSSSLAGDRVLAELFRMTPFDGTTVSRGVIPYSAKTPLTASIIAPNGASGSVLVNPFRALIGSRTAVATDAKANWRDIRTAVSVGTTTLAQTLTIAANASGNPRWDLVYAQMTLGANETTTTRKVKDPTTKTISPQSVVTTTVDKVVLGVLAGTPSATPVWPATPGDSGTTYYIPLAYVRVPTGFTSTSTVLGSDISIQAPILALSRATGGRPSDVADTLRTVTTAQQQAWGSTGTRPRMLVPMDFVGGHDLLVTVDMYNASSANWSHASDGVVDSRDWRGRLVRWVAIAENGSTSAGAIMPWNTGTTGGGGASNFQGDSVANVAQGQGQSININTGTGVGGNRSVIATINGAAGSIPFIPTGVTVNLYVDHADSGKLKVFTNGSPHAVITFWLTFSGPFSNK